MTTVLLSIGSNVGDKAANLKKASLLLQSVMQVEKVSSFWKTSPVDFKEQDDFLNACILGSTRLAAEPFLASLKQIESQMGTHKAFSKGPRLIDLDILFYGSDIRSVDPLTPHPRYRGRLFVLAPLCEIAPLHTDPRDGKKMSELLGGGSFENQKAEIELCME